MSSTILDASVIICTYADERLNELVAAVRSVQQQQVPPREIIVVVDHNPALLARVGELLADVKVVENRQRRGLSGARNSGIAQAQSAFIAFLDDDAVAAPDWLPTLYQHCQDEQVLGVGGGVVPWWETTRPAWFPEEFYWVVGCTYLGLPEKLAPVRNPFGGAMCVRKEIFETVGGFREEIGRLGKRPVGCEETELCIRAAQQWPKRGFWFEPRAKIYHRVTASRASWKYFCSRCYAEGFSKAYVSKLVGRSDGLSAERTYTMQTLPRGVLRGLRDAAGGHLYGLGRAMAILAGLALTTVGYAVGSIEQNRAASNGLRPIRVRSESRMGPPP